MSLNKKIRVLIADDVHETRRNTRVMLSMIEGIEVAAIAMNGLQAVEMAEQHQPDIVVLDINMPQLNGLAAYRRIVQTNPNIACIIISAEKDPATLHAASTIGIHDYLIKPFNTDELEAAVRKVNARMELIHQHNAQSLVLHEQNKAQLKQLAEEYSKNKRSDDQALQVFEELAEFPDCELRLMQTLAIMYVIRQKWEKLKYLAERIEQRNK